MKNNSLTYPFLAHNHLSLLAKEGSCGSMYGMDFVFIPSGPNFVANQYVTYLFKGF